jgi:hypothetical protein
VYGFLDVDTVRFAGASIEVCLLVGRWISSGGCSMVTSEGLRGSGLASVSLLSPTWIESAVTSSSSSSNGESEALIVLVFPVVLL